MTEHEFSGEIVLVTGAAGAGIGQAIARCFAAGGATVIVTDKHPRRTSEVTAAIRSDFPTARVEGYVLDMGDVAQIEAVASTAAAEIGSVTILINNAAVNVVGSIFDYPREEWDRAIAVNLTGPWFLSKQLMRQMRDAGGGNIVNISSFVADVGGAELETAYAVTKGGLNTLTRSCAFEGAPHNIRANTITMGIVYGTKYVDTFPDIARWDTRRLPGKTMATDIAEAAAFLASPRAANITGETLNVAAGVYMRN